MSISAAVVLMHELADLGVQLRQDGEQLFYRPDRLVDPALRSRIVASKAGLLEMLALTGSNYSVEVVENAKHLKETGFSATSTMGRRGRAEAPAAPCYECDCTRWWRLRTGSYWVCACCHPPMPPASEIVSYDLETGEEGDGR